MSLDTNGQRIGIFGGTFDPVHQGHLLIAECIREALALDEVRFMPAAVSPFKQHVPPSEAKHRVEMVKLAIGGNPDFVCDDREIRRGGTSYTVETLRELQREHPDAKLFLMMGADALADLDQWREPAEICRLAFIAVAARGGRPAPNLEVLQKYLPANEPSDSQQHVVSIPQVDISSSEIRDAIRGGRSIRYQVPASVAAYIAAHGLYRD
ncbi:MAG: nicotinate-nucleotide adenylyltransferase [Pirellulales bacterium]